jgi:YggT family protein
MSADYLINPAVFLIKTVFSLYVFALLLRFVFQWVSADYYNPISQFLIKITHPPLRLLRRFIPAIGRVDTASLVLMLGLQMLGGYLIFTLEGGGLSFPALLVWSVAELLDLVFNLYFFAIVIRAVLSWVGPSRYNPAVSLLYSLTEPLLRSSRRLIPPMGGIDLSPLIPLIGIQLARMLVLPPLQQLVSVLAQ